jgi:hypothetical protein
MKKFALSDTGNSDFGKRPTKQQKLQYIADVLGLDLSKMQGTSRSLFDTFVIPTTNTLRSGAVFFSNANGKSENFSNFQQQQLLAGESLMIEKVLIELLQLQNNNLSLDTNQTLVTQQLTANSGALGTGGGIQLTASKMFIKLANTDVVKDYIINEANPVNNAKQTAIQVDAAATGISIYGPTEIELESPPVFTQNQNMQISLSMPPYTLPAVTVTDSVYALRMTIGKFGSIYSPKNPV